MDADPLGTGEAFRRLIEQSPFSTQIHTADGTCVFVNQAWERLWGVTLAQIGGYNILEDQQLVDKGIMPYIRRAFAGETVAIPPVKYEPDATRPGASTVSYRWITAYAYPIVDAQGRVSLVAMTGEDITARVDAEVQAREAEEQYRAIFEATNDALIITDADGFCVEANPAACRLYGYAYEEMIGLHATAATHPDYHSLAATFLNAINTRGSFAAESIALRKDGTPFHIETRASRFMYHGRPHILAVVRDVSERVQAREILEQHVGERTRELSTLLAISHSVNSTLELRLLLGLILDQLGMIIDHSGSAIHVVEGNMMRMLEQRPREQKLSRALVPLDELRSWPALQHGESFYIDDTYGDSPDAVAYRRIWGKDWNHVHHLVRSCIMVPLILKGNTIGAMVISHHEPGYFTPRRRELLVAIANQAAVAIENARLYARAQEIAALEERQRLARELHDSVSQALYGIALGLQTARSLLDRDPARVAEPLDYALTLARTGLAEMRALIFELRPEALATQGLVEALNEQITALRGRHGIAIADLACAEPEAAPPVKEALYRIAQEALHNAVKHASATSVDLCIETSEDGIVLEVRDDGRGFDLHGAFPGHLGLHTMRERATRLGGTLHVETSPGCGTVVRAMIPYTAGSSL